MDTQPLEGSLSTGSILRSRQSKVEFRCEAKLGKGESIMVVGSHPTLGMWKHTKGVELWTSPETYPIWKTNSDLYFDQNKEIEYRYCVLVGGAFSRWEESVGTRKILPISTEGHVMDVLDTHRSSGYVGDTCDGDEQLNEEDAIPILTRTLSTNDQLLIVTMFLPIKITKDKNTKRFKFEWSSLSILSLFLRELVLNNNYKWVGCLRTEETYTLDEQIEIVNICKENKCIPVFINPEDFQLHYIGYCKGYLWPIFHNILDIYGDYANKVMPEKLEPQYQAYKRVNKLVEKVVKEEYHEGELIWIMDYQLMLLPFSLRRHLKPAKIGFVFYVPFPSSDVFSTIKQRKELITSLLSCDSISFQSFSSARHFGNMCHRYMKVIYRKSKEGVIEIEYNGKVVPVIASHCGIEPEIYEKYIKEEKTIRKKKEELEVIANGRQVIGSYEMEERLKGIPYKLAALYQFFERYSEFRNSVCVIMYLTTSPCRGSDFSTSVSEIHRLVDTINTKFGKNNQKIIELRESSYFDVESRIALWTLSDLYFSTPLRDGLHLIALEYVYIRKILSKKPGTVIISELTGCARLLNGSIRVNPWRTEEIVSALYHVFGKMSYNEKQLRQIKNEESFIYNSASQWARIQLETLKKSNCNLSGGVLVGLGLGNHIIHLRSDFRHLKFEDLRDKYVNAKRRLILTDYGGTLIPSHVESKIEGTIGEKIDIKRAHDVLFRLTCSVSNTVFVTSGRLADELTASVGDIKELGLAAEHGYIYKLNNKTEWRRLIQSENDDYGWKNLCYSIMTIFKNRTNGTSCAIKGCSVVWEYKNADPDYGPIQAKELCDVLDYELANYDVKVILEDYYIEVRPNGVDKGNSTNHFINLLCENGNSVDFIMAIGDDSADEPMFEVVKKYANMHRQVNCFTVTVGQKPSEADYYFNDVNDCLKVLEDLGRTIGKVKSVTDLQTILRNNPENSLSLKKKPVPRSVSAIFPQKFTKSGINPDDMFGGIDDSVPEEAFSDDDEDDDSAVFV